MIRGVFFSTPATGTAVATWRVRRGKSGILRRIAAYRHAVHGLPPSAPHVGTDSAGDAAMAEDSGKMSRKALDRADALSEIAILWGLVIAIIVVVIAMMKGVFW